MYTNAHGLLFVLTSAVLLTVLGVLGYLFWNRQSGRSGARFRNSGCRRRQSNLLGATAEFRENRTL